jgi:phosphoribosyl-AMP cyclohydrolase
MTLIAFAPPGDHEALETGLAFTPRFDAEGLIPAIATDAGSGEVVMFAWMNAEALAETIRTGYAHYWSRSRRRLWKKGEESGNLQAVIELRVDCDQDALWLRVRTGGHGGNCHRGYRSCFYRRLALEPEGGPPRLAFTGDEPLFDPAEAYRKNPASG